MSADDDTFDIDIYGDDTKQDDQPPEQDYEYQGEAANGGEYEYEDLYAEDANTYEEDHINQAQSGAEDQSSSTNVKTESTEQQAYQSQPTESAPPTSHSPPQQGTKRKAPPDDEEHEYDANYANTDGVTRQSNTPSAQDTRPLDPGAMPALKLADMNWWTTEEDLRAFCARAGVENDLRELAFGEHKINGKSRGEAYLEFSSPQAATAVKREIEKEAKEGAGPGKTAYSVYFSPPGNPFKTGPAASGNKKDYSHQPNNQGGAYNQNYGHRGNFGGRGRGGFNQNRGGGYNNFNNNQNMYNQQQGGSWGMNGGMAGGGYGGNPMMGGYGGNPMMGGFGNNMGRGGMMNMMGRGGYGGNMGMNMGMNRGGGMMGMNNMMGRGGWGGGGGGNFQGGMQQGYGGGGFQGGMQQQGNKRAKME